MDHGSGRSVAGGVLNEAGRDRLEEAYRSFGAELWRGVYGYSGGRRDVADEAVAEAFAQAGRRVDAIRELRPWLFRAAFRIAAGELKASRRPGGDAVSEAAASSDGTGELMELTRRLSNAQRRAFVLRDVLGFPTREAAALARSSEIAIRVHLHAARRRLRELLQEEP